MNQTDLNLFGVWSLWALARMLPLDPAGMGEKILKEKEQKRNRVLCGLGALEQTRLGKPVKLATQEMLISMKATQCCQLTVPGFLGGSVGARKPVLLRQMVLEHRLPADKCAICCKQLRCAGENLANL